MTVRGAPRSTHLRALPGVVAERPQSRAARASAGAPRLVGRAAIDVPAQSVSFPDLHFVATTNSTLVNVYLWLAVIGDDYFCRPARMVGVNHAGAGLRERLCAAATTARTSSSRGMPLCKRLFARSRCGANAALKTQHRATSHFQRSFAIAPRPESYWETISTYCTRPGNHHYGEGLSAYKVEIIHSQQDLGFCRAICPVRVPALALTLSRAWKVVKSLSKVVKVDRGERPAETGRTVTPERKRLMVKHAKKSVRKLVQKSATDLWSRLLAPKELEQVVGGGEPNPILNGNQK